MAVVLPKQKLAYFPVPKVACTSIKHFIFEIENGRPYEPFTANSKRFHIHKLYPGKPFQKTPTRAISDFQRLVVVRDPIKRLLSCYSNRVIYHEELSKKKAGKKLIARKLTANPELDEFIDRLEDYQKAQQSILHHARPMVHFLGRNAGYFSKVYPLEEVNDFVRDVNERTGTSYELGRHQTGGPKLSVSDIPARQMEKLKQYYARDYAVFGAYF